MTRTRKAIFRDAKSAGMTAETIYAHILETSRDNTGPHSTATNVINELDALDNIEAVFGKRARRRCEKMPRPKKAATNV